MGSWMNILIPSIASIVASTGFWSYMQKKDNNRKSTGDATTRLLMGLAYDKITSLGMRYVEIGRITKDEYEDFRTYLYDPYKALGGNGVAERIFEEVAKLPIRSNARYSQINQKNTESINGDRRYELNSAVDE